MTNKQTIFAGYLTIHRGIPHIFSLPNTNNILGFYDLGTKWNIIQLDDKFTYQPQPCNLLSVACNVRKYGEISVINNF